MKTREEFHKNIREVTDTQNVGISQIAIQMAMFEVLADIRDILYREDHRPRCECGELATWLLNGKDYCDKHKDTLLKENH